MNEHLLQFIWQFQYYNQQHLASDEGEALQVLHPGQLNRNQGPDFLNASIRLGNTTWAGNIELHVLSSDWQKHRHSNDPNYRNVILHVVWEKDDATNQFPTLVLKERVPKVLLERYAQLMQHALQQACTPFLPALSAIGWMAWKERVMIERLERKSARVCSMLQESNNHWEEVLWWMLAANFGIAVNTEAFEAMARSIPVNILAKHKHQLHQLEALLQGQANLLHGNFSDYYAIMLQKEYLYLRKKYKLTPNTILPHFLRMRPANFPTVRLAQLAVLINTSTHLFSKIRELGAVTEVKALLDVTANDYWHYHYRFDDEQSFQPKHLGRQMADNIIINTIVPVLFTYGMVTGQNQYEDKAISWLQQLSAEQNAVTRLWVKAGVSNHTAFDSQALKELTTYYCNQQRCLECAVGNKILGYRNG